MAEERPKGSYTYPNISDDPDRKDVLKNRWGIETHSELRVKEYRATAVRMLEIAEGDGPQGNFDKAHLKAIHGYIFQDVYEWAGHTRNETPIVDGEHVEPIGGLSKGSTSFLPGSRIEMGLEEALKPIRDPQTLRDATPEQFAERAGQVLAELNYVHPFREGNGRAQEAFISELGRQYGHEIDFSVISKPRMIEASIETTNDPSSHAMKHVVQDALEANRREAIREAFADLKECGEEPLQHNVRTAQVGEEITGQVLGVDDRIGSLVTERGIVVADRADLPAWLPVEEEITFNARSDFSRLGRQQPAPEIHSPTQAEQSQHNDNSDLKTIGAQVAAQRSRERDDDNHER